MDKVKPGFYRHFKGGAYEVIGTGKHSETVEELVVYKSLKDGSIWLRPRQMFFEKVKVGNKLVTRFSKEKRA